MFIYLFVYLFTHVYTFVSVGNIYPYIYIDKFTHRHSSFILMYVHPSIFLCAQNALVHISTFSHMYVYMHPHVRISTHVSSFMHSFIVQFICTLTPFPYFLFCFYVSIKELLSNLWCRSTYMFLPYQRRHQELDENPSLILYYIPLRKLICYMQEKIYVFDA